MSEINADITPSFNENFCTELEYHLSAAFRNSSDKQIRSLWCDGVKMPFLDSQLTKYNVLHTKQIVTEAFIGSDGQGLYDMVIVLGQQSLEACINGKSLKNCLPNVESMDWIKLDTLANTIELQLN